MYNSVTRGIYVLLSVNILSNMSMNLKKSVQWKILIYFTVLYLSKNEMNF